MRCLVRAYYIEKLLRYILYTYLFLNVGVILTDKTMESIKHKDDLRESMLKSDNESSIMKREQKVDTDLDGK